MTYLNFRENIQATDHEHDQRQESRETKEAIRLRFQQPRHPVFELASMQAERNGRGKKERKSPRIKHRAALLRGG